MEIAILGLGCFWGPEIKFSNLDGVVKTEVGYCGGNSSETTYKEVCTGTTNHAESIIKIFFSMEAKAVDKFTTVVVLPTPPFWFAIVIIILLVKQ